MIPVRDIIGLKRTFEKMKALIHNAVGVDIYWTGLTLKENASFSPARVSVLDEIDPTTLRMMINSPSSF